MRKNIRTAIIGALLVALFAGAMVVLAQGRWLPFIASDGPVSEEQVRAKLAADGWPFRFGCIFTPFDQRRFTAVAPGAPGGNSWSPPSYNPKTGDLYVCSRDSQYAYKAVPAASGTASGGQSFVGVQVSPPLVSRVTTGALTAMNMATNRIVWRHRYTKTAFHQIEAACESGSLTPKNISPMPMPALNIIATQDTVLNSGSSSSRPSGIRPYRPAASQIT